MEEFYSQSIIDHFKRLPDPRINRTKKHELIDIIVIAICATISGAEGWEDFELYGLAKYDWFKTFLRLPNGIPSHDTFSRVFSLLNPNEFQNCFSSWADSVNDACAGKLIAIDGKVIRRSFDHASEQVAIHMVHAWCNDNKLLLGQVKVTDKSNEITAVPKLLEMLNIEGCTVTFDAMGCQRKTASQIQEKKGDYVFSLKGNQGNLHEEVESLFEMCRKNNFEGIDTFESTEKGHGRIEHRKCYAMSSEGFDPENKWSGLKSVAMIESTRSIGEKVTTESRYFISSLAPLARPLADSIRGHWGIENSLHWCLDVQMNEDQCRIRKGHATENFALLRRIALNLLRQEKSKKNGIKSKSKLTGWDHQYLLKVLLGQEN
jgi:predicted transposase YbfD/YdcC